MRSLGSCSVFMSYATSHALARSLSGETVTDLDVIVVEQLRLYRNVAHATNGWAVVSSTFLDALCSQFDRKAEEQHDDPS